jgi:hypothetical protein
MQRMANWFAKQRWIKVSQQVFSRTHPDDAHSDHSQWNEEPSVNRFDRDQTNNARHTAFNTCVWYDQFAACVNRFTEEDAIRSVKQALHVCRKDVTVSNAPPRLMATMHTKLLRIASVLLSLSNRRAPKQTTQDVNVSGVQVIEFPKAVVQGRMLVDFEDFHSLIASVFTTDRRGMSR